MASPKRTILFVCTHNSARSQLAEAILRHKFNEFYLSFSAGTNPTSVNPYVKQVLMDMEIEISKHESKNVNKFIGQSIDLVVTVCDSAKETCPFFPGAKNYLHKSFKDPNEYTGTDEEILEFVRQLKDEISSWIEEEFTPSPNH